MQILIDIPEKIYDIIKNDYTCCDFHKLDNAMYQAIHEGYPMEEDDNYHNGFLDGQLHYLKTENIGLQAHYEFGLNAGAKAIERLANTDIEILDKIFDCHDFDVIIHSYDVQEIIDKFKKWDNGLY